MKYSKRQLRDVRIPEDIESRPQRTKGARIFMCPHFYETTHP